MSPKSSGNMARETPEAVSVARQFIGQAIVRISHLEQLLLGLATLGFIGWGFLHTEMLKQHGSDSTIDPSLLVFAALFSGTIACAFNGLFIGRMAINMNLISLERFVKHALSLTSSATLYQAYFEQTSRFQAGAVYYTSALFLPLMSLCSLVATAMTAIRTASQWSTTFEPGVVAVTLGLSALVTLVMTIVNGVYIGKVLGYAYSDTRMHNPLNSGEVGDV